MSSLQPADTTSTSDLSIILDALVQATAKIAPPYFQLPVARLEAPLYRERVYCYELYHQLRLEVPAYLPYSLSGEVDKLGHPLFHQHPVLARS